MQLVSLVLLSALALPAVDKPDAEVIQKALNQSVELAMPDAQELANLTILAGGRTANGDYLFVCEGDFVWKLDRQEYLDRYKTNMKSHPLGDVGAQLASRFTPKFKKGDVVTKARVRVRLEQAGNDLIAMSCKTILFDLGVSAAMAESKSD